VSGSGSINESASFEKPGLDSLTVKLWIQIRIKVKSQWLRTHSGDMEDSYGDLEVHSRALEGLYAIDSGYRFSSLLRGAGDGSGTDPYHSTS
jgi:hypothetical protein